MKNNNMESSTQTRHYRIYALTLGNQTKNELAKADQSVSELMLLVGNAAERY